MEQKETKLRLVKSVTPQPERKDKQRTKPARITGKGNRPRPGGDAA